MNQTNPHFTQWKNLTEEEQSGFDFEGFKYEYQNIDNWYNCVGEGPYDDRVYRLVIQPEKFYWTDFVGAYDGDLEGGIVRGSNITEEHIEDCDWLRPATEAEIPKPERVFKDGAFYPVIMDGMNKVAMVSTIIDSAPVFWLTNEICFIESAFFWIGEELTIEWGKL